MSKWEELSKEVGSLLNLTMGGVIPLDMGITEFNKLMKENGFPEMTKDQFIQKFAPKPKQIKMTPEQMEELAKKGKEAREKAKTEKKEEKPAEKKD